MTALPECRKGYRGNSEQLTSNHLENDWLLWEPGAGGWRPGGSENAASSQG